MTFQTSPEIGIDSGWKIVPDVCVRILWAIAVGMGIVLLGLMFCARPTPDGFSIGTNGASGIHRHDHPEFAK